MSPLADLWPLLVQTQSSRSTDVEQAVMGTDSQISFLSFHWLQVRHTSCSSQMVLLQKQKAACWCWMLGRCGRSTRLTRPSE